MSLEEGAILVEVPEAQDALYRQDSLECLEEAGFDPNAEVTPEQLKTTFAWYVEIATCLDQRGYSTPEAPSEQVFIDTYSSDPWIPWIELDGAQLAKATEECPAMQRPGDY